jgi:hypothetical protein
LAFAEAVETEVLAQGSDRIGERVHGVS